MAESRRRVHYRWPSIDSLLGSWHNPGREYTHWLSSSTDSTPGGQYTTVDRWPSTPTPYGKVGIIPAESTIPLTVDCRPTAYGKVVSIIRADSTLHVDRRQSTDSLLKNCQNPDGHCTAVHRRPSTESCQNPSGEYHTVDRWSLQTPYGKVVRIPAESTLPLAVDRRPTPYWKVRIQAESTLPLTVDRQPTPYGNVGIIQAESTIPLTVDRRPTPYGKVVRIPAESTLPLTVDRRPTAYGKVVIIPADSTLPLTVDRPTTTHLVNRLREWHERKPLSLFTAEATDVEADDVIPWKEVDESPPLINPTLLSTDTEAINQIVSDFSDVFSSKLGRTGLAEHRIETGRARPIRQAPYRLAHAYRTTVKQELDEMEQDGIIEPSTSEWASPIVLVPKKMALCECASTIGSSTVSRRPTPIRCR